MTDTAAYVEQALAVLALVKSEAALNGWDDAWTNTTEYLLLTDDQVKRLEDERDAKLRWLWGVGAGE